MALDRIIRNGVALADRLTQSLQPEVTYEAWTGSDGYGGYTYAAPVQIPALIEKSNELVGDADGNEIRAENVISILRPIDPNGAEGREEPIDPRDRVTLPDGATGPIASSETFVDTVSGNGYYHIIYLGSNR